MKLKPFNQTIICQLIIGRLVGRGETTMTPPSKFIYEALAAILFVVATFTLSTLGSLSRALLPDERLVAELSNAFALPFLIGFLWLQ